MGMYYTFDVLKKEKGQIINVNINDACLLKRHLFYDFQNNSEIGKKLREYFNKKDWDNEGFTKLFDKTFPAMEREIWQDDEQSLAVSEVEDYLVKGKKAYEFLLNLLKALKELDLLRENGKNAYAFWNINIKDYLDVAKKAAENDYYILVDIG